MGKKLLKDFNLDIDIEGMFNADDGEFDLMINFLSKGYFYIINNEDYPDSDWDVTEYGHKYIVFFISHIEGEDILYSLHNFEEGEGFPEDLEELMEGTYGYGGDLSIEELSNKINEHFGVERRTDLTLDELMNDEYGRKQPNDKNVDTHKMVINVLKAYVLFHEAYDLETDTGNILNDLEKGKVDVDTLINIINDVDALPCTDSLYDKYMDEETAMWLTSEDNEYFSLIDYLYKFY